MVEREETRERDALIAGNIRLVVYIAKKFIGAGLDFNELVSVGNMGLVKAADRYDPEKGIQFSTFASVVVSNEIRMALKKLNRTKRREISLDTVLSGQEDGRPLLLRNTLRDEEYRVGAGIEAEDDRRWICAAIEALGERERTVIRMRYGIGMAGPHTQADVARRIGCMSQSYVSRLEKKAIKQMRTMMVSE